MNIIKRVIGLPGDWIEVRGKQVLINDKPLSEDYAQWVKNGYYEGNYDRTKIPEGKVFLMGDNRDFSKDSRFWADPFLPIERIKGRALFIYWSWSHPLFSRIGKAIR